MLPDCFPEEGNPPWVFSKRQLGGAGRWSSPHLGRPLRPRKLPLLVTVRCNILPNRVWGHKVQQIKACMGNQRKLLEIGLRNGGHIAGSHLDKSQLAGAQYDISYDALPAKDTANSSSCPCCRAVGAVRPHLHRCMGWAIWTVWYCIVTMCARSALGQPDGLLDP